MSNHTAMWQRTIERKNIDQASLSADIQTKIASYQAKHAEIDAKQAELDAEQNGASRLGIASSLMELRRELSRIDAEIFRAIMDADMSSSSGTPTPTRPAPLTREQILEMAEQRRTELKAKIDALRANSSSGQGN